MDSDRAMSFGSVGLLALLGVVEAQPPLHFEYHVTSNLETPLPGDLAPVALLMPISGEQVVGQMDTIADPNEAASLVGGAMELLHVVASALPYSQEDDDLITKRMADLTRDLEVRPVRRITGAGG